jgi:hypothetical protein
VKVVENRAIKKTQMALEREALAKQTFTNEEGEMKTHRNLFNFSPKNPKKSNISLLKEVKVLRVQALTQKVPKDTIST